MFLRFIELKIKPDTQPFLRGFYENLVVPDLRKTAGCRYAGLVQGHVRKEEFIFISLWEANSASETYQSSPAFLQFQRDIQPLLAESTEWKLQLSENLQLEYSPAREEPIIRGFKVTATSAEPRRELPPNPMLHLRLISLSLQKNKMDEFRALYNREIIPALLQTPGCLYACLIEGIPPAADVISMTIWANKQSADLYENDGQFSSLVQKVRHTFSEFFQWKMALERDARGHVRTSEDIKINTYGLVVGGKLKKKNET